MHVLDTIRNVDRDTETGQRDRDTGRTREMKRETETEGNRKKTKIYPTISYPENGNVSKVELKQTNKDRRSK